mgnify:CR=1 FL=1
MKLIWKFGVIFLEHYKTSVQLNINLALTNVADGDFPIAPKPTPTAKPSGYREIINVMKIMY